MKKIAKQAFYLTRNKIIECMYLYIYYITSYVIYIYIFACKYLLKGGSAREQGGVYESV